MQNKTELETAAHNFMLDFDDCALAAEKGFYAGAAHMQKRIEELETALIKERQISKMLEEALRFYKAIYSNGDSGKVAITALAEVQKLRDK